MLPSSDEITEFSAAARRVHRWPRVPGRRVIQQALEEARELDAGSGDARCEAAALFFAFGGDEQRLGRVVARAFVLRLVAYHLGNHALALLPGSWRELLDLRDRVAEGDLSFAEVLAWFRARAIPAVNRSRGKA